MFESLGFENAKTLQNSGNAVLETKTSRTRLVPLIEKVSTAAFSFESQMTFRSLAEIEKISHFLAIDDVNKFMSF